MEIMTQEDKELILKDLCARLPYGVKAVLTRTNCRDSVNKVSEKDIYSFRTGRPLEEYHGQHDYYRVVVTDIKPYLFPLSSMTDEQKKTYNWLKHSVFVCHYEYGDVVEEFELYDSPESIEYLIENHFDYRGLIPMVLAIDATGLNIY